MINRKTTYLKITTLQEIFFEGPVKSVTLRTKAGGAICLQPNRTPFFSTIDICELTINTPRDKDYKICSIGGGLVYADASNINIITDDIIFGKNINIERAKIDRDFALAQLEKFRDTKEEVQYEIKLRKALNRIDVYNRNNN
ncbi:F0F1 ATP synthase subunit epsilon [Mycoplasmopsis caviae]|uniref:ATP synthase epsilon chain n=1 Tax=Mycoplasmopsis caviae TaxID=55603 RepID=A0A3P8MDS1_9BACT|nr:F0F1 ATP synthase subunit epsilon [Mycoplasmopsis caviae]UUD35003.1 F0F1 ATP synthase subunit epsilon [Mycoplasmopsis caviae]VDR42170.1 ATP synthase epsilon chain [Mycoplasmopsis caviae]